MDRRVLQDPPAQVVLVVVQVPAVLRDQVVQQDLVEVLDLQVLLVLRAQVGQVGQAVLAGRQELAVLQDHQAVLVLVVHLGRQVPLAQQGQG